MDQLRQQLVHAPVNRLSVLRRAGGSDDVESTPRARHDRQGHVAQLGHHAVHHFLDDAFERLLGLEWRAQALRQRQSLGRQQLRGVRLFL